MPKAKNLQKSKPAGVSHAGGPQLKSGQIHQPDGADVELHAGETPRTDETSFHLKQAQTLESVRSSPERTLYKRANLICTVVTM
ncbi:hypothetical protein AAVH_06552 [Aphelenchoides avenae]|nr:hypothetical protein AAVH_06552 [Aphelenchus avenae]